MAADKQDTRTLTEDDEVARRLCAMMVAFSNAQAPISTTEVRDMFYPDLADEASKDAFLKKYSRDRMRLAQAGFVVHKAGMADTEALWKADDDSFADGSTLLPEDAMVLDVLCAGLVEDPSFAHRHELRLALAKIDRAFGALTAVRLSPDTRTQDASAATLLSCMSARRLAQVTYIDARGSKSVRDIAPYGTFGLRDQTYFVCALAKDGVVTEDAPTRTLRADRFARVKALSSTFEVPADFSVEDHILLPFQIGPILYTATLASSQAAEHDAMAELRRHGTPVAGSGNLWQVPVSNEDIAAAWCVASGMQPLEPQSLAASHRAILESATHVVCKPDLTADGRVKESQKVSRRGRHGASTETRELLALVSSLSTEGASLSVEGVSSRLGVDHEQARHLLELVLTACSGSSYQLPLSLDDGDTLVLSRSKGVTGRPIRLNRAETEALVAALDVLGVPDDDPLRSDILSAFAHEQASEGIARGRVDQLSRVENSEMLEACSWALIGKARLSFEYLALGDDTPHRREVAPSGLRHENGQWYLDAYDLDRGATRTFRLDRMSHARVAGRWDEEPMPAIEKHEDRLVTVAFSNSDMLVSLEWPGLRRLGTLADGSEVTSLPYYGGTWLPRHLAACGNAVTVDDEEVAEGIRLVAAKALAAL